MFTILITVGGYLFDAQADAITKLGDAQLQHVERIAKLEAILEGQKEINKELKEIVKTLSERE
jgi:hypothetical protein